MSRYRSDPEMLEYEAPSFCSKFLHYTWKTISCLFSHITLVAMVVSYCVLGAYTFASLEVDNELQVKKSIHLLREEVIQQLWNYTTILTVFKNDTYIIEASKHLKSFEDALLKAITKDGWDGEENDTMIQWSFTGSLFYSIIVITTIGYGNLAPRTTWGKVVTIFYAILGIPLMLICLSNIGDVMATSFRFLYWRVCCYVCTKKPRRRKSRSFRGPGRGSNRIEQRGSSRSRNASFKRSVRNSTRSADSGFELSDLGGNYHSDTDLRYHEEVIRRGSTLPRVRGGRLSENNPPKNVLNSSQNRVNHLQQTPKGNSLDRKRFQRDVEIEMDPILLAHTPILCNKYVVGKNDGFARSIPGITVRDSEGVGKIPKVNDRRAKSMPRNQHYLEPPRFPSPDSSDREELESFRGGRRKHRHSGRRSRSPNPQTRASPRMMTPLGYGHSNKYLDDPDSDDDYYYDYYDDFYDFKRVRTKPVPIWLCVLLVVSYILAGAYLFKYWENWNYLDAAYFCFITLTTIGFGDLVPAKGEAQDANIRIALCSLYLLFGISLLAMSFNLVQDEVISKVKSVAKTLGIIKKDEDDLDDEG
ncbi:uncharacterized protein LOC108903740 isoform X2 [Anoplophora glabripennis]|uniref:uncharacterized protein LOC108903740 isoform X2 n=1 Tax=Anoplophora glabripennis TaxID=217634 RepID=UPI000873BB42|nr:uncharacterized protein LOC108903740 isoform X2 [Anoplophora glabripennis]